MSLKYKHPQEYSVSFEDFKGILKKNRIKIIVFTLGMILFASFWTLTKEPKYLLEATFKEKGKTQVGLSKSLAEALFNGGNAALESEAISLMKSKKLTEALVQKLDLQAKVFRAEKSYPYLASIRDNLKIDLAHFKKSRHPVLADNEPPLVIKNITYPNEVPINLNLKFNNEESFTVVGPEGKEWGEGELGVPFKYENMAFTLYRESEGSLTKQKLGIEFQPLFYVAENISKSLLITPDKNDKTLLIIQYPHRDRFLGSKIVNEIMDLYRQYLRDEHLRISTEQLGYLENRRNTMGDELKHMMDNHARNLSLDLNSTGFPNSAKALEFMANTQNDYRQKLLSIDLESKRLYKAQEEDFIYYDRYTSHGDPVIINEVLAEIRLLKQQADSLDLALRNNPIPDEETFIGQMTELKSIQEYAKEAQLLITFLDKKELPKGDFQILTNNKYMVKTWYDKLFEYEKELINVKNKTDYSKKAQVEAWQMHFKAYLTNLLHLFQVHERTLQERLTHQQSPQQEFQGIDLATSKELYLNYNRQLNDVQAQARQAQFILDHMQQPNFEISALSTVLTDSVSQDRIAKASALAISLHDDNNRSDREQTRLKDELEIEKKFLQIHLKQTLQLLGVREGLLKDKISDLQNVTLGLVHQQISILEKHLDEYITTRLSNLKQERGLILDHQLLLQKEMSKLPNKWVVEKMIDQKMAMNQLMVEELTKMVESKNISTNLEMVLSAPVDEATPPILPKSPRLILYLILGAVMGFVLSITYVIVRSILEGIPASPENLNLLQQHVSGKISKKSQNLSTTLYLDKDLETLRRAISYLSPDDGSHEARAYRSQSLVIIEGNGPDYSFSLADLLAKKGLKVILLPLRFDTQSSPEELPGLLQYIEGAAKEPKITRRGGVDIISPGGVTRFASEVVTSPAFSNLIGTLQDTYDWIVVVSPTLPRSAQAESLIKYFDHSIITLSEEKVPDLESLINLTTQGKPRKKSTFIFTLP